MGPVSGLRPPSPRRYKLDRSASLTGTRLRPAARRRKSSASAAATVRSTGTVNPPCGGIRSCMGRSPWVRIRNPLNLIRNRTGLVGPADEVGKGQLLEAALFLGLEFFPD